MANGNERRGRPINRRDTTWTDGGSAQVDHRGKQPPSVQRSIERSAQPHVDPDAIMKLSLITRIAALTDVDYQTLVASLQHLSVEELNRKMNGYRSE